MTRMFRTPWDAAALATAEQIERHMALALTLDQRDDTHPSELRTALERAPHHVQVAAHRAMDEAAEMCGQMYANFITEPQGPDAYQPLYDKPSERVWSNFAAFGGRGGTKTRQIGRAVLHQMRTEPNIRVGCLRAILKSLSDSVHAQLCEIIRDEGWTNEFDTLNETIRHKTTGSSAVFAGLQNVQSLKSTVFDLIWLEEASEITQDQIDVLIPSVRAKNSAMLWSWNPEGDPEFDQQDAVDKMFRPANDQPPERSVVVYVDAATNEFFYRTELPAKQRTAYRTAVYNSDFGTFRHVWRGHYKQRHKDAAIKVWKLGAPALDELQLRQAQVLRGCDWSNGGSDPHAGVRALAVAPHVIYPDYNQREPNPAHKPVLFISGEFQLPASNNAALARTIRETIGEPHDDDPEIIGDSANPGVTRAMNDEYGIRTENCEKFPGSVAAGIGDLNGFDLFVSPNCPKLAKQLTGYRWHPEKADKLIGERHLVDALRYAIQKYDPDADGGVAYLAAIQEKFDAQPLELDGEPFKLDW